MAAPALLCEPLAVAFRISIHSSGMRSLERQGALADWSLGSKELELLE